MTSQGFARENGEIGEKIAYALCERLLKINIHRVNDLIDFFTDTKIPIEVKTCQVRTVDKTYKNGYRTGRFVLKKEQHEYLQNRGGLYLFIVLKDTTAIKIAFIYANDFNYKRLITHTEIFNKIGVWRII